MKLQAARFKLLLNRPAKNDRRNRVKKVAAVFLVGTVLAVLVPSVSAEGAGKGITKFVPEIKSYSRQATKKLCRGVANLGRSVTEFYVQPKEAERLSGKKISRLWPGLGEASGMFLTRMMGGLIEAVLFPFPFPNGWKPLLEE